MVRKWEGVKHVKLKNYKKVIKNIRKVQKTIHKKKFQLNKNRNKIPNFNTFRRNSITINIKHHEEFQIRTPSSLTYPNHHITS